MQNRKKKSRSKQKKGQQGEEKKDEMENELSDGLVPALDKLTLSAEDADSKIYLGPQKSPMKTIGKDPAASPTSRFKKLYSSDSEYSDAEGGLQSKIRLVVFFL